MKPVIKQYAASGSVALSPSTTPIRCCLLKMLVGDIHSASSRSVGEGDDPGRGSDSFSGVAIWA